MSHILFFRTEKTIPLLKISVAHRSARMRSPLGARALIGRRACDHRAVSDKDVASENGNLAPVNRYLLLKNVKQSFLN